MGKHDEQGENAATRGSTSTVSVHRTRSKSSKLRDKKSNQATVNDEEDTTGEKTTLQNAATRALTSIVSVHLTRSKSSKLRGTLNENTSNYRDLDFDSDVPSLWSSSDEKRKKMCNIDTTLESVTSSQCDVESPPSEQEQYSKVKVKRLKKKKKKVVKETKCQIARTDKNGRVHKFRHCPCRYTDTFCRFKTKYSFTRIHRKHGNKWPEGYKTRRPRDGKGKKLQCGACGEDVSYKNFSRHVRKEHKHITYPSPEYNEIRIKCSKFSIANPAIEKYCDCLKQNVVTKRKQKAVQQLRNIEDKKRQLMSMLGGARRADNIIENIKKKCAAASTKMRYINTLNQFLKYLQSTDEDIRDVLHTGQLDLLKWMLKAMSVACSQERTAAIHAKVTQDDRILDKSYERVKAMLKSEQHKSNSKVEVTKQNWRRSLAACLINIITESGTRPIYIRSATPFELENPTHVPNEKEGYMSFTIETAKQQGQEGVLTMTRENWMRLKEICKLNNPDLRLSPALLGHNKQPLSSSFLSKIVIRYYESFDVPEMRLRLCRKSAAQLTNHLSEDMRTKAATACGHSYAIHKKYYATSMKAADASHGANEIGKALKMCLESESKSFKQDLNSINPHEVPVKNDDQERNSSDVAGSNNLSDWLPSGTCGRNKNDSAAAAAGKKIHTSTPTQRENSDDQQQQQPCHSKSQPNDPARDDLETVIEYFQDSDSSNSDIFELEALRGSVNKKRIEEKGRERAREDREKRHAQKRVPAKRKIVRETTSLDDLEILESSRKRFIADLFRNQRGPKSASGCPKLTEEQCQELVCDVLFRQFYANKATLARANFQKKIKFYATRFGMESKHISEKLKHIKKKQNSALF